ncbi:doublesex- and mab-3-related transcription factor C1-like, partial [Choloepus didactylus]
MNGADPPEAHSCVKKLALQAEVFTGKKNIVLQPEAHSQESSLLLNQTPEHLSLPGTPVLLNQQLTVPPSGESHGPPDLPSSWSTLILQPCATLDPPLLQPQVPGAFDQASVSAPSEWQRKLEAAETLLTLRDPPKVPSGSISLLQPCGAQ